MKIISNLFPQKSSLYSPTVSLEGDSKNKSHQKSQTEFVKSLKRVEQAQSLAKTQQPAGDSFSRAQPNNNNFRQLLEGKHYRISKV